MHVREPGLEIAEDHVGESRGSHPGLNSSDAVQILVEDFDARLPFEMREGRWSVLGLLPGVLGPA